MTWIMPFPEKAITGEYGTMSDFRRKNKMQAHSGTDWAPAGSNKGKTPIPAIAKGTIKLIQWSNVLGWVVVQTAMDKDRKVKYIGYCHVACGKHGIDCKGPKVLGDHMPIQKKVGDKLEAGDTVAIIGNTGSASSGCHLHATLSDRIKGVFGATADKQDLKKAIKANSKAPKAAAKVAPVVTAKPVNVIPEKPVPTPIPRDLPKAAPAKPLFYKVQPGDYLSKIASENNTTVSALMELNGIKDANKVSVGQMIRLFK